MQMYKKQRIYVHLQRKKLQKKLKFHQQQIITHIIMAKKIILLALSIFMASQLGAQEIQDTNIHIGTQTIPGYIVTLPQDVKTVQNVVNQKLKDAKLKTTKSEGYTASLQQVVNEIATFPINLYVKVDEQGRRSEKVTVLMLCAAPMNIADRISETYVRRYVETLVKDVARQEATEMLAQEEKNLKKAQKDYKSANSDLEKMNKNIASDQEKIASNQKEMEKLQSKIADLEARNKKLEDNVNKNTEKKGELEKKATELQTTMQETEKKVETYKMRLQ